MSELNPNKALHCPAMIEPGPLLNSIVVIGLFLLLLGDTGIVHGEDSIIRIRLSYKIILNPTNFSRPSNREGQIVSDEMIQSAVNEMNRLLSGYWRGYRFELTEIVEIGWLGLVAGNPGRWFDVDFMEISDTDYRRKELPEGIHKDRATYAWRDDTVNLYVNRATNGATWWKGSDLIILGAAFVEQGWFHLHEIGHFFNLYHTHGINQGKRSKSPLSDNVTDTIRDLPKWTRNEIALENFDRIYADLSDSQRRMVDDVAENVMSYHFEAPVAADLTRLTEGQLDRWTDATSCCLRDRVVDGRTWFVDQRSIGGPGSSEYPFQSIAQALQFVNPDGGDILLVRPGVYASPGRVDTPVTIRATRAGAVTIGGPVPLIAADRSGR